MTFDEYRYDNHCWIKFRGIDWHIDCMESGPLLHCSFKHHHISVDLSGADLDSYAKDANRMIMEAYREEALH